MDAAFRGAFERESRSDLPTGCRFDSSTCRRNSTLRTRKVPVQSRRALARLFLTGARRPVLVHVPAPVHAQVIVYDVFSAYLNSLRDQAGIPGLAAAIVDADGAVWEQAYGRQDVGRAIATRTDTPFNADGLTQASLPRWCCAARKSVGCRWTIPSEPIEEWIRWSRTLPFDSS